MTTKKKSTKKPVLVSTVDGYEFELTADTMSETDDSLKRNENNRRTLERSDLKAALRTKFVAYQYNVDNEPGSDSVSVELGRNSIDIGCMVFQGDDARTLKDWAKSKVALPKRKKAA